MPEKPQATIPIAGSFVSASGLNVKVRCATVSQVVALATAEGNAEIMKTTAAIIDACADVEGLAPGQRPSDFLTVPDGQHVVRLAQSGGEADFT